MATANPFGVPSVSPDNPLAPEYLALERQKRIADLLMSKSQQVPEGQMVSGHYVAPSITQQLQPLANAYIGQNMAQGNEAKTAKLAQMLRGQDIAETKGILDLIQGSSDYQPAVMPEIRRDDMGNAMPAVQGQIGTAPNSKLALEKALQSQGSVGKSIANTLLTRSLEGPKEFNLGAEEVRYRVNPDGSVTEMAAGKGKIEKPPVSYQEYQLAKQEGFKGSYNDYQTMDSNRRRPVTNITTNVMGEQKTFENTQKLRSEFRSEPIYKAHQEVQSAYKQVKDGLESKSPAGDLAAATKFMKLLDPGSVVRESELALAMKAGGALDRLSNYASRVANGTKLTPKQREDFQDLSTKFFNTSAQLYNSKQQEFVDIAKRYDFNPKDVTGDPSAIEIPKTGTLQDQAKAELQKRQGK